MILVTLCLASTVNLEDSQRQIIYANNLDEVHYGSLTGKIQTNKVVHDPFFITNDTQFVEVALQEGWVGNGSATNPYKIQNYFIDAQGDNGIVIVNDVTMNYTINDNHIINAFDQNNVGILIAPSNSKFIEVTNNTIETSFWGISVSTDANLKVINNTILDMLKNGMVIDHRSDEPVLIENNQIERVQYGIWMEECTTCLILANTIVDTEVGGITLLGSQVSDNIVKRNIVSKTNTGIWLADSVRNLVIENVVFNSNFELHLANLAYHNNITRNIFAGNPDTVLDESNHFNPNYWNKNLYSSYGGSGSFQISGDANSVDSDPLPLNHDFDMDGTSDLQEVQDGTNPFDSSDFNEPIATTSQLETTTTTADVTTSTTADVTSQPTTSSQQVISSSVSTSGPFGDQEGFNISTSLLVILGIAAVGGVVFLVRNRLNRFTDVGEKSLKNKINKEKNEETTVDRSNTTVSAIACPSCGTLNNTTSVYCIECGSSLK